MRFKTGAGATVTRSNRDQVLLSYDWSIMARLETCDGAAGMGKDRNAPGDPEDETPMYHTAAPEMVSGRACEGQNRRPTCDCELQRLAVLVMLQIFP
nr:hypothetical protein CFP56_22327 [Quercus suber]